MYTLFWLDFVAFQAMTVGCEYGQFVIVNLQNRAVRVLRKWGANVLDTRLLCVPRYMHKLDERWALSVFIPATRCPFSCPPAHPYYSGIRPKAKEVDLAVCSLAAMCLLGTEIWASSAHKIEQVGLVVGALPKNAALPAQGSCSQIPIPLMGKVIEEVCERSMNITLSFRSSCNDKM